MKQEAQDKTAATGGRWRRLWLWLGGTVLGLVILFLLVVFVLPNPAARYLIDSQLDRLGIEHDGIDTVDIDLWNSRVSAGPIRFRSSEADHGQIGEAGFTYSFSALLKKRAFIQVFFLRGVDIAVKRLDDGSITVNGIALDQLAKEEPAAASDEAAESEAKELGIGLGIKTFEFTDSRLLFEDFTGGKLTIEIDRLDFADFRTWTPESKGRFALRGSLNGIQLRWDGSVRPLADPILVELHSRFDNATIDKVAVFTGPTGLERQAGTIGSDVRYDYAIHSDGRIEGTVAGVYSLDGLDIGTANGESLTIEKAELNLDLAQRIAPDGSLSANGQIKLDASSTAVTAAAGERVEVDNLYFAIADLAFEKKAETRELGAAARDLLGAESMSSGRAPTLLQLLAEAAKAATLNALKYQLELHGQPSLKLSGGRLSTPARDGQPGQRLEFETLEADLGQVDSQTLDAGWSISTVLNMTIAKITGASGAQQLALVETQVTSQGVELRSQKGDTSVVFDLAVGLRSLDVKGEQGTRLAVAALDTGTAGMTLEERDGASQLAGPVTLSLQGLEGELPQDSGKLSVTGEQIRLDLPRIALAGQETLAADLSGSLELGAAKAEAQGDEPRAVGFANWRSDFSEVRIAPLGAEAKIEGSLSSRLNDLTASQGGDGAAMTLATQTLETSIAPLSFDAASGDLALSGSATIDGIETVLPLAGTEGAEATVARIDVSFPEIARSGGALRSKADIEARKLALRTLGETPQTLDLEALRIEGLEAEPAKAISISAIAVEGLAAKLTEAVTKLAGGSEETPDRADPAASSGAAGSDAAEPGPPTPFSLDKFSVSPGSTIQMSDTSVEPPVRLDITLDTLEVGPLDTGKPDTKTNLDLQISLGKATGEAASGSFTGWASPLKATPDFDLSSDIAGLSLPPFSAYATSAVGVEIDSGSLSAKATAAATDGALNGQIDLLVGDLYLASASDEIAQGFEASFGVPIGFAVGILKDSEGNIDLGFPVSGTLDAPEIDYSEVIDKAIGGAMASLFPTNWFGEGGALRIEPVVFAPGSAEMTEDGEAVADKIGELLTDKPSLSIRACGKATASDLSVLRGETPPEGDADATQPTATAAAQALAEEKAKGAAPVKPSQQEVDALLTLASQRGAALRSYLASAHEIDPKRLPECRTTYSIEDSRPPRAEFLF